MHTCLNIMRLPIICRIKIRESAKVIIKIVLSAYHFLSFPIISTEVFCTINNIVAMIWTITVCVTFITFIIIAATFAFFIIAIIFSTIRILFAFVALTDTGLGARFKIRIIIRIWTFLGRSYPTQKLTSVSCKY